LLPFLTDIDNRHDESSKTMHRDAAAWLLWSMSWRGAQHTAPGRFASTASADTAGSLVDRVAPSDPGRRLFSRPDCSSCLIGPFDSGVG
jgi:hypothetical protein